MVLLILNILAAFGGIAGLFLGCSLLSAVEIIYLILIEIPQVVYTECQSNNEGYNSDDLLTTNHNNIAWSPNKRPNFSKFQGNIRFVQPQSQPRPLPPPQYSISNDISRAHLPIFYYE